VTFDAKEDLLDIKNYLYDTAANRPAAGTEGRLFVETDTGRTLFDNGSSWVEIGLSESQIDHDSLNNFVANEHIDHSSVSLSAGTHLTGGGDLTASRTFNVDETGIEADNLSGSNGSNGQLLQTDGSNVSWVEFQSSYDRFALSEDGTSEPVIAEGVDEAPETIWVSDSFGSENVIQLDQSGSVLSTVTPPATPYGMDVDETSDTIWIGALGAGSIYEISKSGSVVTQFASPSSNPYGVDVDERSGCLWVADNSAGSLFKLDQTGNIETQIAGPGNSPIGVDVDERNSCLWIADSGNGSIYRTNQSGSLVTQFSVSAGTQIRGVDVNEKTGCLWLSRSFGDSIYNYTQAGSLVTQFSNTSYSYNADIDVEDHDEFTASRQVQLAAPVSQNENCLVSFSGGGVVDTKYSSSDITARGFGLNNTEIAAGPTDKLTGGFGGSGCLWVGHATDSIFYKINQSGSIASSVSAAVSPDDLDYEESTGLFWTVDIVAGSVYSVDGSSGSIVTQFSTPSAEPLGVTVNEQTGCLWHTDNPSFGVYKLFQTDRSGSITNQASISAAGYVDIDESTGSIWTVNQDVKRFNQSGSVINSFTAPGSFPKGLAVDEGTGCVWHSSDVDSMIYRTNKTGSVIESFSFPNNLSLGGLAVEDHGTSKDAVDKFKLKFNS